jgi:hypothetical protein
LEPSPAVESNVRTVCERSDMLGPFESWREADAMADSMDGACERSAFVQTADDAAPFYVVCPYAKEAPDLVFASQADALAHARELNASGECPNGSSVMPRGDGAWIVDCKP